MIRHPGPVWMRCAEPGGQGRSPRKAGAGTQRRPWGGGEHTQNLLGRRIPQQPQHLAVDTSPEKLLALPRGREYRLPLVAVSPENERPRVLGRRGRGLAALVRRGRRPPTATGSWSMRAQDGAGNASAPAPTQFSIDSSPEACTSRPSASAPGPRPQDRPPRPARGRRRRSVEHRAATKNVRPAADGSARDCVPPLSPPAPGGRCAFATGSRAERDVPGRHDGRHRGLGRAPGDQFSITAEPDGQVPALARGGGPLGSAHGQRRRGMTLRDIVRKTDGIVKLEARHWAWARLLREARTASNGPEARSPVRSRRVQHADRPSRGAWRAVPSALRDGG